jgi:hypothetical protein
MNLGADEPEGVRVGPGERGDLARMVPERAIGMLSYWFLSSNNADIHRPGYLVFL